MATVSGVVAKSIIHDDSAWNSSNLSAADDYVTLDGYRLALGAFGTRQDTQPVGEHPVTVQAVIAKASGGNTDFYNRIIITPSAIEAGNVINPQTYSVSVWNGYLVTRTLSSITAEGTEGMTLTPGEPVPATFSAIEEQTFTLLIGTNGPALIDAAYTLHFDSGEELLTITGQRIFAWNFAPDWSRPVVERLEWLTDVITSHDGTEQRIGLRVDPRRNFEFAFAIDNARDRRKFEALLYSWGARTWLLPIWTEGQTLTSSLPAGAMGVTLGRVTGDFVEGGNVLITLSAFDFEIAEIATISGNALTFARQLEESWPAGAKIYPALPAYLESTQKLDRFTGDVVTGIARMRLLEVGSAPAAASETAYRGLPVITEAPTWARDLTADHQRKLAELDFGTGIFARDDEAGMPFLVLSHHWIKEGKESIDALRSLLYARAGRQKAAWLPTFLEDLIPVAQISSGSTAIDVEFAYVAQHLSGKINRRDIRIETTSGTIYYRRVTGAAELDENTERLSIDSGLPVTLQPSEVSRISWLALARLETDGVEINWQWDDWAEVSANWRTVRDDV